MAKILVTGGTGALGRQLVQQLCYQGFDAGIITTRAHVDAPSGAKIYAGDLTLIETLKDAVEDAEIVIHCASNPKDSRRVDIDGTTNLLKCIGRRKVRHFVYVSIAGVDRSAYPYYQAKYEAELIIGASDLPWSVLRATQFHGFVLDRFIKPADLGNGSPMRVPAGLRFQPIDIKDVALQLQMLSMGEPLRSTITIAGPEILTLEEMARTFLAVQGRAEAVETEPANGLNDVFLSGGNVNPEWKGGRITWKDFLKGSTSGKLTRTW
jgi:uncharacterized protein YbjT (DUF2867 family)